MPDWYYEKKELKNTPSYLAGLDYETETRYRREGARFIQEVGKALGLRHDTMATAAVYFHRFYMFHSFQEFPRYCAATCTMFLAGKAEETPKKCRDLIKTVRGLTNDAQFNSFGQDPREEVMTLERVLLQTIKFDLQVDHPYSSLLKYAKCLKGDKAKLQKMVQMSWTFVNDSLCTTLCLQWEPEVVAIALMYLAAKLSKFEVKDWKNRTPEHTAWWDQYVKDLDTEVLEDICHQVLDLYSQPTTEARLAPPSPPPGERKPPPPQAPAPPQNPAPPAQPPQPSQPPAPKPALPPSHPVASQPRSAPPPGAPGYTPAPSYPVSAPPAPGYPPQTAPAPTGYPASAPYPAYAAVAGGYQAVYAAPQAGSHFPAQGATYGYPGQQAAGQVLPPAQTQVQGRPNGPPTPGSRGPPPSDNRSSRGPPPGDYRRGPPPAEHRGPPPDHRVPHSDSYHRSTPPDHRGGASADHRGGPPPDHRGGPPHDGFRGGAPQDHRGGAPADHRGGPPPDQRGGAPHDGFRGGAPQDHRGAAPADHRGGPPHDGFRGRSSYDRGSRGPPPRAAPPPPHRGSPYGRPPRSRGGGYGNSRY